jgi:hypothetical protein
MLIVLGVTMPGAAVPDAGTLYSADQVVSWAGETSGGIGYAPPVHTPETCALAAEATLCDEFDLTVNLPAGTFTKPNDGLFVALRWETDFNEWNLFVYAPDGTLAASGYGIDSTGQAVVIPHAANGVYKVLAVPVMIDAVMSYTGEARVLLDGAARIDPSTVLAPRLWTIPPYDFKLACSSPDPTATATNGRCADVPPVPSSAPGWRYGGAWMNACYTDEAFGLDAAGTQAPKPPGDGVRKCLRFSNVIRNAGTGPLVLRADYAQSFVPGTCRMQQVVMRAGGVEDTRDAGACEFHAAHGHFHYLNTSQYSMIPAPGDATTAPDLSAAPVAAGRKLGYCLIDIDFWGDVNNVSQLAPRNWSFPTCDLPGPEQSQAQGSAVQEMGISPGWGDIYTWDLPGQYLDITNVADGTYDVVSIANPDCALLESAPGLEGAATRIRLSNGTVTVLGEFGPFAVPGCSVPTP